MENYILKSNIEFSSKIPNVQNVSQYILSKIQNCTDNKNLQCIGNSLTGESFSYNDVGILSKKVASFLHSKNFCKGDTVLYSSHDGAKLHIFLIGVWRIGGIARSSYPEDHGDDLIGKIKESQVKWIFCDQEFFHENIKAAKSLPWNVNLIVSGDNQIPSGCYSINMIFSSQPEMVIENLDNFANQEDIALILQTSGTTGSSKGAVYTHSQLLNNIQIFQHLPFIDEPKQAFLLTSRLTHFTGTVIPLSFFAANRRILVNPKPCKNSIVEAITKYKVRAILAFPKFLTILANEFAVGNSDLASLKFAATAGQVVGPSFVESTLKRISSLRSLYIIYGMSEVGIISVNADWHALKHNNTYKALDEFPAFSCGKLAPGNEMCVKDLKTGELLPPEKIGEFYFRSPYAATKYLNRPQATEETFQEGWVRSGDVGYYDEKGFIYIKDRVKEIFKYFNNHICPSELENILLKHSYVAEACVVGVPDPEGGDSIPRAFVVVNKSDDNNNVLSEVQLGQIQTFLDDNVPSYKRLRGGIFQVHELPYGKSGKVLRKALEKYNIAYT